MFGLSYNQRNITQTLRKLKLFLIDWCHHVKYTDKNMVFALWSAQILILFRNGSTFQKTRRHHLKSKNKLQTSKAQRHDCTAFLCTDTLGRARQWWIYSACLANYLIFPPDHEKTVPKDQLWCLFVAFPCKACKDVFTGHNVQRSIVVIKGFSLSLKVSGVVRTTNGVRLLFISSSFSFFLSY